MTDWRLKGGPKNHGRFAIVNQGRVRMGSNHKPMTKAARMRFFRMADAQERRLGWRTFYTLSEQRRYKESIPKWD